MADRGVDPRRGARAIRGFALATASALVASLSHVAGGGGLPAPALLIAALGLSGVVSVAATGRRVALWRTAIAVNSTQLTTHAVLSVADVGLASPVANGHAHAAMNIATSSHAMPMTSAMLVAHLLAATVTVLLLRFGESAFWTVTDAARHALRAVRLSFSVSLRTRGRMGLRPLSQIPAAPRPGFAASTSQRGPPALV